MTTAAARTTIVNADEAEAMIAAAEKRCRTRCYASTASLQSHLERATAAIWMFDYLTVEQMVGTELVLDAAQGTKFASSYNGTPESTHAALVFTKRGWQVTSVTRGYVSGRQSTPWMALTVTDRQIAEATAKWSSTFGVYVTITKEV